MRVFIYEVVIGGGFIGSSEDSLLTEGLAMATALVEDFGRLPNVEVEIAISQELATVLTSLKAFPGLTIHRVEAGENHFSSLKRLFQECDAALILAPEFSGLLEGITRFAAKHGAKLLSPAAETVALFSDKQKTADWLGSRGLPVPHGCLLQSASDVPVDQVFPAVVKPNDGAGSIGVQIVNERDEISALDWTHDCTYRLESIRSGQPASVAILCGGTSPRVLAPCRQLFDDGTFDYRGGCVLADGELSARAARLGERVARVLPPDRGYLGVDLVLGEDPNGSDDCVIEVNPRITTSYVGLRASTDVNLAHAILNPCDEFDLRFPRRPLEFRSDGSILDSTHKVNMVCDG